MLLESQAELIQTWLNQQDLPRKRKNVVEEEYIEISS